MKTKSYIKFTLINETDDDALNNIFIFYLLGIIECVFLALLIGEINIFTIILLTIAAGIACYLAYRKGCDDAK